MSRSKRLKGQASARYLLTEAIQACDSVERSVASIAQALGKLGLDQASRDLYIGVSSATLAKSNLHELLQRLGEAKAKRSKSKRG